MATEEIEKMETEMKKMDRYVSNLDGLKRTIAEMSVDMTGSMQNKTLLVRVVRGRSISFEYYQNGDDGYNNNERFWYEFPVYFYMDMPSGYFVRETSDGNHYLVDENEQYLEEIDINELMNKLIDDLIETNYKEFNDNWNEFLAEFQKWLKDE